MSTLTHLARAGFILSLPALLAAGPGDGGSGGDSPGGGRGGSGEESTPFYEVEWAHALVVGDAFIDFGAPYADERLQDEFIFGLVQGKENTGPFTGMHLQGMLEYHDFTHESIARTHADAWIYPIESGVHIESFAMARAQTAGSISQTETGCSYFTMVEFRVTLNAPTRLSYDSFIDFADGGNAQASYDVIFLIEEQNGESVYETRCSNMNPYAINCEQMRSGEGWFDVPAGTYDIMIGSNAEVLPPVVYNDIDSEAMAHLVFDITFALSPLRSDLDGDGDVNGADMAALLGAWGRTDSIADIDQDGIVGGADLSLLLGDWN